jgi:hypothetical protein
MSVWSPVRRLRTESSFGLFEDSNLPLRTGGGGRLSVFHAELSSVGLLTSYVRRTFFSHGHNVYITAQQHKQGPDLVHGMNMQQ